MKKFGLFLLAVVMVAGLAGCGGGDDDHLEFDMNGTWLVTQRLIQANCTWQYDAIFELDIAQAGNTIIVEGVYPGNFNPETGTFGLTFTYPNGVAAAISGVMNSEVTFIANEHDVLGGCYGDFELRGELLHRRAALPGAGAVRLAPAPRPLGD